MFSDLLHVFHSIIGDVSQAYILLRYKTVMDIPYLEPPPDFSLCFKNSEAPLRLFLITL